MRYSCCLLALISFAPVALAEEAKPSPEQLEYFEKHVRPVLVEKCVSCHGDKKQQGGVRLDSRTAMDQASALVPGKPGDSRLVQVIKYSNDDIQMPPSGKMPDDQIAAITKWIEMGAPWPQGDGDAQAMNKAADAAGHWSFQPILDPPVPTVQATDRVRDPIDAFVIAKLEENQLTLSDPADKATFIRRATLDLWGIPPTYDEVQAFLADTSTEAVPRLIDRLLDSPLYGQRWARHWLDIARYADTKGYVFTEEPRYPYAYTYRDYVVDSFNADKPYNRFVMEQIAADQLDIGEDQAELAAMGFLTVGRRFLNKREDIIDDRIDVVTRGLMAVTVGCARCHDHKYDPIPTADYYSLFGVFNSSQEPGDLPIIGTPKNRAEYEKFQKDLAEREKALADYEQATHAAIVAKLRSDVASYLILVVEPKAANPGEALKALITGEPRREIIQRWKRFLDGKKDSQDRVFGPWIELTCGPDDQFAAKWDAVKARLSAADLPTEGAGSVNVLIRQSLLDQPPANKIEVAQRYGAVLADVEKRWQELKAQQADATALPDAAAEELRQVLYAENMPTNITVEDSKKSYLRDERNKQRDLVKKIENLNATSPGAPPRAMVMNDKDRPEEPRILVRGNPGRPGDQVPRQFLQVVAGPERKPFTKGSGRLELAQAIVDPSNPLTSRVIVNRVWQHHFGEGLVRTPGDFGIRGEAPTHPELLDHLATWFMQNNWSLKALHRRIMTSSVYGQQSLDRPEALEIDPENRLLWKKPRQRLEFEALRDSWLAVAGRLDTTLGGRPFDNINDPNAVRRTLYAFLNRNDLPGVFRSFDMADVDTSMAERPETTVPQQALFGLNAHFLIEQSRHVSTAIQKEPDDTARVTALFRRVLSRDPTSEEREFALHFLKDSPHTGQLNNYDKLSQVLLLTNEFIFVD
ncbi:DUF1553 domain-containing protein [bacterium]|nr:DUF1553 domain-containing protein [bacterium]